MSDVPILLDDEPERTGPRGDVLYTSVCLAAALMMALPLLARGLPEGALLPALCALVLPLVRWRAGPIFLLLAIGWTVLADRLGIGAFALMGRILESLVSLLFFLPPRFRLPYNPWPKLQQIVPVLDLLFCVAVLTWIAAYYRLLSVTRSIFPIDRRRRGPSKGETATGKPILGPVLEHKRAVWLVDVSELGRLLIAMALCAVMAEVLWRWLRRRDSREDLAFLVPLGMDLQVPPGLWRLMVLVWVLAVVLIVTTGVLAYLGQLRLTPAEAGLYLQDQLWRQTRREQARLHRYLAWAEKREERKKR